MQNSASTGQAALGNNSSGITENPFGFPLLQNNAVSVGQLSLFGVTRAASGGPHMRATTAGRAMTVRVRFALPVRQQQFWSLS